MEARREKGMEGWSMGWRGRAMACEGRREKDMEGWRGRAMACEGRREKGMEGWRGRAMACEGRRKKGMEGWRYGEITYLGEDT